MNILERETSMQQHTKHTIGALAAAGAVLFILIALGQRAHGAVIEQVGGAHVAWQRNAGAVPARGESYADAISGRKITRLTDCSQMANPYSSAPPSYTTPGSGITNGYSRYTNQSRNGSLFIEYGTSQLTLWGRAADLSTYTVCRQKDGTKILGELWEGRLDLSGNPSTEDRFVFWGSDGYTLREQHLLAGAASERIIGKTDKPHVHKGDLSTDNASRWWPVTMADNYDQKVNGKTVKREVDSLTVMDQETGKLAPQRIYYDLAHVDFNGASISPDGVWLQGQLDFYRVADMWTSTALPVRLAIRGGHGAWIWRTMPDGSKHSVWAWQEEATDYLQVGDPNTGEVWQVMPHSEYAYANSIHLATIFNPAFSDCMMVSTYGTTYSTMAYSVWLMDSDKPLNRAPHPKYIGDTAAANAAWDAGWTDKATWARIDRLGTMNTITGNNSYYAQSFASWPFFGRSLQWGDNWGYSKWLDLTSLDTGGAYADLKGSSPAATPTPTPTASPTATPAPSSEFIPYGVTKPVTGPATVLYEATPTPTPAPQTMTLPFDTAQYFNAEKGDTFGPTTSLTYVLACKFIDSAHDSNHSDTGMLCGIDLSPLTGKKIISATAMFPYYRKADGTYYTEYGGGATGKERIPLRIITGDPFMPAYVAHPEKAGELAYNGASWCYRSQTANDKGMAWSTAASLSTNKAAAQIGDLSTALAPIDPDTVYLSFPTTDTTAMVDITKMVNGAAGGWLQFALDTTHALASVPFAKSDGSGKPIFLIRQGLAGSGSGAPNERPYIEVVYQ